LATKSWRRHTGSLRDGLAALKPHDKGPMILILSTYLIAGLALVFVGPAAKGLRLELADLADNPEAAPVKRAAFAGAVALAIILFWPLMVPSAWRTYRPPTAMDAFVHLATKALHDLDKQD
jgi:hypothetical protein